MRTQGQGAVAVLDRPTGLTPSAAFDKFLDHRATMKNIADTTNANYVSRLRLFAAYLEERGIHDIREVTVDHLEEYVARLRNRTDIRATKGNGRKLSSRSVHTHFVTLRALFRFLYARKHVSENLVRPELEGGVYIKSPPRKQKIAPKRDVVEKILNLFDPAKPPAFYAGEDFGPVRRSFLTVRNRCLIVCMAGLGLRSSEVLGLRLDQIDWKQQTITFKAKGEREREDRVDFPDDIKAVLAEYFEKRQDMEIEAKAESFFFTTFDGRVMDRDALRRLFNTIREQTGHRLSPHMLRYFAGTEFYRKTKDLVLTQRFLRHRDVKTTTGYLGIDSEEVREKTLSNSPVAGLLRR